MAIAASASQGERACSATIATNAPSSITKADTARTRSEPGCQSRSTEGTPTASQNSVAAPHASSTAGSKPRTAPHHSTAPPAASTAITKPTRAPFARPISFAHSLAATSTISRTIAPNASVGSSSSAARMPAMRTMPVAMRVARAEAKAILAGGSMATGATRERPLGVLRLHALRDPGLDLGVVLRLHLLARAPEAALAPGVRRYRGRQRARVEIGPQQVGVIKLGVGELPQQEVGDPLLAARADEQVGLGCVRHRE